MSKLTIYDLGDPGVENNQWRIYQSLKEAQINIVPGLLIKVYSDKTSGNYLFDEKVTENPILKNFVSICLKQSSGASIYWNTGPTILGIPKRFDCWQVDLNYSDTTEKMNYVREFVEQYCSQTYGYIPEPYKTIEEKILRNRGLNRVWQLGQKDLAELINNLIGESEKQFSEPFPLSLLSQITNTTQNLIHKWREKLVTDGNVTNESSLLICLKMSINRFAPDFLGSNIMFSSRLSKVSNKYSPHFSPGKEIDDIYAGVAPIYGTDYIRDLSEPLQEEIKNTSAWLDRQDDEYKLDCVITKSNVYVVDVQNIDIPVQIKLKQILDHRSHNSQDILNKILSITPNEVKSLLIPELSMEQTKSMTFIGSGIPASPGVCSGVVCFDAAKINDFILKNIPVLLVSHSPTPDIVRDAIHANGLLFSTGGTTSHIAVIARGLDKPCVLGASSLIVDRNAQNATVGGFTISSGDWVTLDGTKGNIYLGKIEISQQPKNIQKESLDSLLRLCDQQSRIIVLANADTAHEAKNAFLSGAKGIGLCRIEHLLSRPSSIENLQKVMLLSWILIPAYEKILIAKSDLNKWPNSKGSLTSLAEAVKDLQNHNVYQHYIKSLEFLGNNLIDEISGILDASKNFPVTIRLIDPPLAEFLSESIIDQLQSEEIIQHEQKDLLINLFAHKDSMIGLRGVRLCNLSPEFTKTQIKSIFIAKMKDSESTSTEINILIPFVADAVEIDIIREMVNEIAQDLQFNGKWQLGTMIETPRAAILAKDMAQKSDFLSFGTNDLTQFTWAASRDYAQSDFLNHAIYSSRLEQDPFTLLDQQGVGKLIELAINEARAISPNIPIGICGEHAGEPQNIEYLGQLGVNYVSCSPISIATIRLACGQFGIRSNAINQSKNQNVH